MMNEILGIAGVFLPIGIVILIVILILATGYVKAGIKIPFLEKKDELNLQLIPIDVKTSSAVPTADYIAQVSREVLDGNMREIVGKMNLEEMVSDRQKFANLVKDIVGTFTQVSGGLKESTGVDVQAVLSGFLGGKIARKGTDEGDAAGQLELGKKAEGEA